MILLNKILPIFSSILILVCFEIWLFNPTWLVWMGIILFLVTILSIIQLNNWKLKNKEFWGFLITPLFLVISSFLFFLFLENIILKHIFIIIVAILFGLFLENVFIFFYKSSDYQPYALENISDYINLVSVFLFSSSFFSLIIFLNFPVWTLMIALFILTLILGYQMMWVSKISFRESKLFILIIGLIIGEVFWSLKFLPTSFYVNGLILTIIYYVLANLSSFHLQKRLDLKTTRRYLIISSGVLILTLITAQWT